MCLWFKYIQMIKWNPPATWGHLAPVFVAAMSPQSLKICGTLFRMDFQWLPVAANWNNCYLLSHGTSPSWNKWKWLRTAQQVQGTENSAATHASSLAASSCSSFKSLISKHKNKKNMPDTFDVLVAVGLIGPGLEFKDSAGGWICLKTPQPSTFSSPWVFKHLHKPNRRKLIPVPAS